MECRFLVNSGKFHTLVELFAQLFHAPHEFPLTPLMINVGKLGDNHPKLAHEHWVDRNK